MSDRPRNLSPIVFHLSTRSATHDRLSFHKPVDGHQDKNQQEEWSVGELEEIMKQFLERENLSIPDNRLQNFVNLHSGQIYKFKAKKPKRKKTSINSMLNLTEMKDKKIMMMGLSGVGKTSMYQVVFEQKKWWDLKGITPTEGIQQYEQTVNSLKDFKLYIMDFAGTHQDFKTYQDNPEELFPSHS